MDIVLYCASRDVDEKMYISAWGVVMAYNARMGSIRWNKTAIGRSVNLKVYRLIANADIALTARRLFFSSNSVLTGSYVGAVLANLTAAAAKMYAALSWFSRVHDSDEFSQ